MGKGAMLSVCDAVVGAPAVCLSIVWQCMLRLMRDEGSPAGEGGLGRFAAGIGRRTVGGGGCCQGNTSPRVNTHTLPNVIRLAPGHFVDRPSSIHQSYPHRQHSTAEHSQHSRREHRASANGRICCHSAVSSLRRGLLLNHHPPVPYLTTTLHYRTLPSPTLPDPTGTLYGIPTGILSCRILYYLYRTTPDPSSFIRLINHCAPAATTSYLLSLLLLFLRRLFYRPDTRSRTHAHTRFRPVLFACFADIARTPPNDRG